MKRKQSFLLPLLTAIVMMAMSPQRLWADGVNYLKPTYNTAGDPKTGVASWSTETATNPTQVTSSNEAVTWGTTGQESWYYVTGNVTLTKGAVCKGNVNLILCDGANLTVTNSDVKGAGIEVNGDANSFTIYAQSTGASMGELSATASGDDEGNGGAAIGGNSADGEFNYVIPSHMGQNITINGGKVTANNHEGTGSGAIGGGPSGGVKDIYINGGVVIAHGCPAIGKGVAAFNDDAYRKDVYVNTALTIMAGYSLDEMTKFSNETPGTDLAKTDVTSYSYVFIHQHQLTHHTPVAATCTTAGNSEYWSCSGCGKYYSDAEGTTETTLADVVISSTGHNYAATFDSNGLKTCSVCGEFVCEEPEKVNDASSAFNEYYAISKPGHLAWFRDKQQEAVVNAETNATTYPYAGIKGYLVNDIDLASVCHAASDGKAEVSWKPIGPDAAYFTGTFDGNNHEIAGLYINSTGSYVAVFGYARNNALIQNLTVKGSVTAKDHAAGILAYVGSGNTVTIKSCTNYVNIDNTGDNSACNFAGIASYFNGTIDGCVNYGTINGLGEYNGGIIGRGCAEIKNCENHGNITGGRCVAGIAGFIQDGSTITNCVNRGTVTGAGDYIGGITGAYQDSSNGGITYCTNYGNVTNTSTAENVGGILGSAARVAYCANYGDVTSSGPRVGGISGNTWPSSDFTVSDLMNRGAIKGTTQVGGLFGYTATNFLRSYSTGDVEATSAQGGLLVGYSSISSGFSCPDAYYVKEAKVKVNGVETANQFVGSGGISTSATAVKSADVASGKLAMLLRGNSETSTWGQDLSNTNKAYPVLGGPKVYFCGSYKCNGVVLTTAYTNDDSQEATIPAHSSEYYYDNDFCSVCGESQTLHGNGDADDPYLISNVAQLEWFRDQANAATSTYTACAMLVNDIDLSLSSNDTWTPICKTYRYAGTFDGKGHTVKNMVVTFYQGGAAGFFGWLTDGSVVKNLTVEGECNTSILYLGMIAGYCSKGQISNCTAKGSVRNSYSSNSDHGTGGIAGSSENALIEGCSNYASVLSSSVAYCGGIIGKTGPVLTMSDCANYGDVSANSQYVAGLVGFVSPNTNNVIKNCFVGACSVRGTDNVYATAGEPSGSASSFNNIVYSQDCKVYTSYTATEPATLSSCVAFGNYNTSAAFVGVSAAQIASGEATYLLNGSTNGGKWIQDLSQANGYPLPFGDANQYGVYLMGYAHGATVLSFSNDASKKNSLHPAAEDGSHDYYIYYTSNGNQTHEKLCSVCGPVEHNKACNMVNNECGWCNYKLFETLELADGDSEYTRTAPATVTTLTYKRTFADNDWNCLYVPFSAPVSGFDNCHIYAINMFQQHDTDGDGQVDDVTLEVIKAPANAIIKANHPYLIKYYGSATGKEQEFTFTNVTLAAAATPEYTCSSMNTDFVFKGTYRAIETATATAGNYYSLILKDGKVVLGKTNNGLKAQRWYMTKTARESQFGTTPQPGGDAPIRIVIVGEDEEATSINNEQLTINMAGAQNDGKYFENGHLVIVKNGMKLNVNGQAIK